MTGVLLTPQPSVRAGSVVSVHALVLGHTRVKESDLIVQLLTAEYGIISAYARAALRSRKRFGGALDPATHVKADLKIPRDPGHSLETPMWFFEKAEVKDLFEHLRSSYEALDS